MQIIAVSNRSVLGGSGGALRSPPDWFLAGGKALNLFVIGLVQVWACGRVGVHHVCVCVCVCKGATVSLGGGCWVHGAGEPACSHARPCPHSTPAALPRAEAVWLAHQRRAGEEVWAGHAGCCRVACCRHLLGMLGRGGVVRVAPTRSHSLLRERGGGGGGKRARVLALLLLLLLQTLQAPALAWAMRAARSGAPAAAPLTPGLTRPVSLPPRA